VDCSQWTFEIMEYARAGLPANPKLQDHLRHCARCAQSWEDERGTGRTQRTHQQYGHGEPYWVKGAPNSTRSADQRGTIWIALTGARSVAFVPAPGVATSVNPSPVIANFR